MHRGCVEGLLITVSCTCLVCTNVSGVEETENSRPKQDLHVLVETREAVLVRTIERHDLIGMFALLA